MAFSVLVCGCLALASFYTYFVGSSVLNIIARKEAIAEIARLEGAIASMEREYFELTKAMSPLAAGLLGLTPVSDTNYVQRPGNAATLVTIDSDAI